MRKLHVLFILFTGIFISANAQVAQTSSLKSIISKIPTDSLRKTERLASILFHEKINQYREANGKTKIGWDDTLWLTASNHNKWMVANDELNHHEIKGSPLFTGIDPGDRYVYASVSNGHVSWCGENILYNYSHGSGTVAQEAENMAAYSFEQWRNSPGHNANMLKDDNYVHAVAFQIDEGGRVWATDIFAWQPWKTYAFHDKPDAIPGTKPDYIALENTASPDVSPAGEEKPAVTVTASTENKTEKVKFVSASSKYVRLDLPKSSDAILTAMYSSGGIKKNRSLSKAAQHHADYMATNRKLVHDEKKQKRKYYAGSPQKRIIKASRGARWFGKRSSEYVESIAQVQADAAKFDAGEIAKLILLALDKEKTVAGGTTKAAGFGIVIKRNRNELTIYAVREEKIVNKENADSEE